MYATSKNCRHFLRQRNSCRGELGGERDSQKGKAASKKLTAKSNRDRAALDSGQRSLRLLWVKRVGRPMFSACRLHPRRRTYRCVAANRRFGPEAVLGS